MSTDGTIANVMDMDHLQANVDLQARTYNLGMVTAMLDPSLTQEIRIPSGISINGNVKVDGTKYATRLALTEGKGSMKVDATVDARTRKMVVWIWAIWLIRLSCRLQTSKPSISCLIRSYTLLPEL